MSKITLTRYEARIEMIKARQQHGMFSPEAIAAEIRLTEIQRAYDAAQKDTRDSQARLFLD